MGNIGGTSRSVGSRGIMTGRLRVGHPQIGRHWDHCKRGILDRRQVGNAAQSDDRFVPMCSRVWNSALSSKVAVWSCDDHDLRRLSTKDGCKDIVHRTLLGFGLHEPVVHAGDFMGGGRAGPKDATAVQVGLACALLCRCLRQFGWQTFKQCPDRQGHQHQVVCNAKKRQHVRY
mgnify:CR=1 FL=1